jgi:hypothetical protein
MALLTIFRKRLEIVFVKEHQRLFLSWAVIAFLLSNHEWFMEPIQPIHFTRGYIWLGLFLFGIPGFFRIARNLNKSLWYIFLFLLLSDNLFWYGKRFTAMAKNESVAHVSNETREMLQWLSLHSTTKTLLVSNEYRVSYMANAYSPSWSWTGHLYNTPGFFERNKSTKNFLMSGIADKMWQGKQIFILLDKAEITEIHPSLKKKKIYENRRYVVYELNS